jgi:hypothetical protein
MASITIFEIDEALNERLLQEARRQKKGKELLIREILAREMGLPTDSRRIDPDNCVAGVPSSQRSRS